MQTLSRDLRIYVLDPANEPAITIDSGRGPVGGILGRL